jgi:protein TonB
MKFTIYHGFAVSLALHAALGLPFVMYSLASPPNEPPTIIIDLQGVVADTQADQKVLEQIKGALKQDSIEEEIATDETTVSVPPPPDAVEPKPGTDLNNVAGVEQKQEARTIRTKQEQRDRFAEYVKLLSKKVRANLVYPKSGKRASAIVSFTILSSGHIRLDTLKIVKSSGQPRLDASALQTIRASVPFDPPPEEVTVAIIVDFDRTP